MMYFDPEVWGTVSDWAMAAITTVTAFYLYRTLKSQLEVQTIQQKLFEIERVRFNESIRPTLNYNIVKDMFTTQEEGKSIFTVQITNDSDNIAFDVAVNVPERNSAKQVFIATELPRFDIKKGDSPWLVHFLVDPQNWSDQNVTFLVTYSDLAKVRYHQPVFATFDEHMEIYAHTAGIPSFETNL